MSSPVPFGRLARPACLCVALLCLAFVSTPAPARAQAKELNVYFGVEGGPIWYFMSSEKVGRIRMNPSWSAGGYVALVGDFEWARNIGLELRYQRTDGRGEVTEIGGGDSEFRLVTDRMYLNVCYFFGGVIFEPFISGGLGTIRTEFETRDGVREDQDFERWNFSVDLGGGLDFPFVEHFALGIRVDYIYILPSPTDYDIGLMSALIPSIRISGRF